MSLLCLSRLAEIGRNGRHCTSSLLSDRCARVVATTDWGASIPQNAGYLLEQALDDGASGASAQHKPEGFRQLEACSGEDGERERSCQIQGSKGDGSERLVEERNVNRRYEYEDRDKNGRL